MVASFHVLQEPLISRDTLDFFLLFVPLTICCFITTHIRTFILDHFFPFPRLLPKSPSDKYTKVVYRSLEESGDLKFSSKIVHTLVSFFSWVDLVMS